MIAIRTKKIEIMEAAMNSDPLIRIQYSAKKVRYCQLLEKMDRREPGFGKNVNN